MSFTAAHHQHLLRHGYVVIPRFLSPTEVRAAKRAMLAYVPSARELAANPLRYKSLPFDENEQKVEFPYVEQTLNHVATHPKIVAMTRKLLGTKQVVLSRSALWAKYAGGADYEQPMHADWEGNTLVAPRDDGDYRQVNIILYYTDVTARLGPTMVVSQERTKHLGVWPTYRYRRDHPELYDNEIPVLVKAGGMLVFSMRTYHRATAILAERGERFTHHMVYRSPRHGYQGMELWAGYGEKEELSEFLQDATIEQREVLGFPPVGDPFWNDEMLTIVAARYPRMNLTPYRRAIKARRTKRS